MRFDVYPVIYSRYLVAVFINQLINLFMVYLMMLSVAQTITIVIIVIIIIMITIIILVILYSIKPIETCYGFYKTEFFCYFRGL
jgi:hypothetical protein